MHKLFATLVLAFALGACSGEADVDINADSTAGDGDTLMTMPDTAADADDANDTVGSNVNADSAGNAVGNAAGEASAEGIEKLVETHLALSPGFSGVQVESEGSGVIVLNGTVASAEEKTRAETEAKTVAGVTSVKNNLTVQAAL